MFVVNMNEIQNDTVKPSVSGHPQDLKIAPEEIDVLIVDCTM